MDGSGTTTGGSSTQGGSARIAAFEDSLSSRIDQMAASGKLSPRQLEALKGVKEQFGSMMARLDRAFFDGENLDANASDVLKHIMDVTSEALGAVVGQGQPRTPGRLIGVSQHEFPYARNGADATGASLDKVG